MLLRSRFLLYVFVFCTLFSMSVILFRRRLLQGRAYIGNFGFDIYVEKMFPVACRLALVHPDGKVEPQGEDLGFPNGMVITPDGKTLIVGEVSPSVRGDDVMAVECSFTMCLPRPGACINTGYCTSSHFVQVCNPGLVKILDVLVHLGSSCPLCLVQQDSLGLNYECISDLE